MKSGILAHSGTSQTLPAKLPKISVYLSPELKADLEKLAKIENRSVSNLAVVLLQQAVDQAKTEGRIE
ncbi:MAG TPA: hypothetical protein VK211_09560 [Kamptonema sp.]|nr:hypothetical protein [Kamptonema sp.]